MKRWSRYTMCVVTIFMVLAMSAMWAVPVLADDETPPPAETQEVVPPPQEESTSEVPPVEEPVVVEEPPAPETEEVAAEEPAVEETPAPLEEEPLEVPAVTEEPVLPTEQVPATQEVPASEPSTPPAETSEEILEQLPDGTDLVVVDETGEALSLVTEEAVEAIVGGDPVWCPVGVAPRDGTGGCSPAYTFAEGGLYALINDILNNVIGEPGTNGVIWIQAGADASDLPIILDGSDPDIGNWENFALTLKGGWNGTFGSTVTNPATPSIIDVPLSIINWNGNITLSDIVITGASGAGTFALDIETTKNILLTNVDVESNTTTAGGASLDTTGGTAGNIAINDSTFNGNSGWGLDAESSGTITGKNLSANNNVGGGASFNNMWYASSAKAVTLTGSNNFNNNDGGDGLVIYSNGAITLSNVTAMYNGGSGAELDNCLYDPSSSYCNLPYPSAVTLLGASNFSHNGWDGLRVWSGGVITANSLTANGNGTNPTRPASTLVDPDGIPLSDDEYYLSDAYGKGAFLNNYGAWTGKPITLTGTNTFNDNASAGLYAETWGSAGAIKVNNLTASGNGLGCDPAETYEQEWMCDGTILDGTAITLTGYGVFEDNYDDGLQVDGYGAVTLNNLYANGNDSFGAVITASTAPVNVLGTNVFTNNVDFGLYVESEGAVTLNNLTANLNGAGVYVNNEWKWVWNSTLGSWVRVATGQPVSLRGVNTFNENFGTGLEVDSGGVITTYAVTANDNLGDGVYLNNCLYDDTPGIEDCTGLPGKAVMMNGNNNTNGNGGNGLYIESLGAITVNNLNASSNGGDGATLDNNWNRAIGGVTIAGFSNTSDNYGQGLGIYSRGAVLTSNLTANWNGPLSAGIDETWYRGVTINNAQDPLKMMNVTLLGVNQFNDNWNTGLQILSFGTVTLNNITANSNGEPWEEFDNPTPLGYGVSIDTCLFDVDLDNCTATLARNVTLNGVNFFNGNFDTGLEIQSLGAILVNKPIANNNGGGGAYLDNQWDIATAAVTIAGYGAFNNNAGIGLEIFSNGNITLNYITANYNTVGGVYLDNWSRTLAPVNVTLNGANTFIGNSGGNGLTIYSDGMITLNNITANHNDGAGAYLDNADYGFVARNILLNGNNTFVGNVANGLEFNAIGSVILTRIVANSNTDGVADGNFSSGIFGTAGGSITLTCGSLNLNEGAGYNLTALTGITLKGVFGYGNGVLNSAAAPTVSITRTCPLP